MNINQLRCFVAVAQHLNFTKAAKHLYISQSSLSQRILELERQIGVRLFVRDHHSVSLTPAGTVLLHEATAIISKSDEVVRIVREAAAGIIGSLKVGFLGDFVNRYILQRFLPSFNQKYPQIKLSLKEFELGSLDEALYNKTVDVAFTRNWESSLENSQISYKKIYDDSLCLLVPSNHSLADKTSVCITKVAKETIVFPEKINSPRRFDNLLRVCHNRKFSPNTFLVPNTSTALLSIECGLGLSILPLVIPKTYNSPNIRCLEITGGDDTQVDLVVACNKSNDNPSSKLFLQELEETANIPTADFPGQYIG